MARRQNPDPPDESQAVADSQAVLPPDRDVRDVRVVRDKTPEAPRTKDDADSSPTTVASQPKPSSIKATKPLLTVVSNTTGPGDPGQRGDKAVPAGSPTPTDGPGAKLPKTVSQVQLAIELIDERFTKVHDRTGRIWAVPKEGPRIAKAMSAFVRAVRAAWYQVYGDVVSKETVTAAWDVIVDEAERQPQVELPIRVGTAPDGDTVLDLGTPTGEVVRIGPGGWTVEPTSPIVFLRTQLGNALPVPVSGGSLDSLRSLLNVSDDDWPLLVVWMVSCLVTNLAHPILALLGEHGTAKTTAARLITGTVDPSSAPSRSCPKDERNWAIMASQSYCIVLDNISDFSDWLSDALCRAVTDDSYVCRRLYTDDELAILKFRRAIVFTAIHPGRLRDDLADRLLVVRLARIPKEDRREDNDVPSRFAEVHAEVLGALLDLVVQVLAILPTVHLDDMPRMASFAKLCRAVDLLLGTHSLGTYCAQEIELAADVLDASPFATALAEYLASQLRPDGTVRWFGTAGELLRELDGIRKARKDPRPPGWPTHAVGVASQLRRTAPAFGIHRIRISEPVRTGHDRQRMWTIDYFSAPPEEESELLPDAVAPGTQRTMPSPIPDSALSPSATSSATATDTGQPVGQAAENPLFDQPEPPVELWYPHAGSDPDDTF